jgi:hypothetical protein
MRPSRIIGLVLPVAAWLFAGGLAGCLLGGGGLGVVPEARAQASLTPPAGQSRLTAPGGLRGRAIRRHRTHRRR